MERSVVYQHIDHEREYQQKRWDDARKGKDKMDAEKDIATWILYMENQLEKAKQALYYLREEDAMAQIRKVTALGVAAMEVHGCPPRLIVIRPEAESPSDML